MSTISLPEERRRGPGPCLSLGVLLAGLLASILWLSPMPFVREIDPGSITQRGGHAYSARIAADREARVLEAPFRRDANADASPVAPLYFAFFQREPDPPGLRYWTAQLEAGMPLEAIAESFARSAEFEAAYPAPSNGEFVDRVYRQVLGRAADAGGRAHWVGELDRGAITRGRMVLAFAGGAEFRAAAFRHRVRLGIGRAVPGNPAATDAQIAEQGKGSFKVADGEIVFSASDNSNPGANGRTYFVREPFAAPPGWLVLALLAGGIVALRRTGLPRAAEAIPFLHWAAWVAAALYLNALFALLVSAPVPAPDSDGYLNGSLFRTPGYPAFLSSYRAVFPSWEYLPLVQLNLVLAGLFVLAHALARVTRSHLVPWLLLALVLGAGAMLLQSVDLLTEALFAALVMAHVAFIWLFFEDSRRGAPAAAGAALAGAILVKSVAVVLLGPLLLVLAFRRPGRSALLLCTVLPATMAWLVPSAWNHARHGVFESSVSGGYALGGHVAWAIRDRPGSAHAEEARRLERRLAPVLARRPADFGGIDAYATYTSFEYNTLLWSHMVPEMEALYRAICAPDHFQACRWSACPSSCLVRTNATLLGLAAEAIRAEPGRYGYHVFAHTQALWREVFTLARGPDLALALDARADELPRAYDPRANGYLARLGPLRPFRSDVDRAATVSALERWPVKRALDAITLHEPALHALAFATRIAPFTLALGLVACAAVARLGRWEPGVQSLCYAALCLLAYFLGTALAQPVVERYSWPMQGVMGAFLLLAIAIALKGALRYRSGR